MRRSEPKADIKYFNLLVHFGPGYEYNLNELMEQAFIAQLGGADSIALPTSRSIQMRELKYIKDDNKIYLTGLLYKSGELNWETIPDSDENPIIAPGTQEIMPYARFILSIGDHRLFWLTKRKLTKSPTANDFCQFLKRVTLPLLRDFYRGQAEVQWFEEFTEAGGDPAKLSKESRAEKREFISNYLKTFKLTADLMKVRAVAETSQEAVKDLIANPKYIIKDVTLYPHMNNVTLDDCEELFTKVDKVGTEAEAEATVNLKATDSEHGVRKDTMTQILDLNEKKPLLKFKLHLQNKLNKDERALTVTNLETITPRGNETIAAVSKAGVKNGEPSAQTMATELLQEREDMRATEDTPPNLIELITTKVTKLND